MKRLAVFTAGFFNQFSNHKNNHLMKKALLIIVLAAAITSCCKKQNTACYRCEHMRAVHGRGAVRIDTLCGMDDGQIRAYEAGEYISNDSVQQSTNCAAL